MDPRVAGALAHRLGPPPGPATPPRTGWMRRPRTRRSPLRRGVDGVRVQEEAGERQARAGGHHGCAAASGVPPTNAVKGRTVRVTPGVIKAAMDKYLTSRGVAPRCGGRTPQGRGAGARASGLPAARSPEAPPSRPASGAGAGPGRHRRKRPGGPMARFGCREPLPRAARQGSSRRASNAAAFGRAPACPCPRRAAERPSGSLVGVGAAVPRCYAKESRNTREELCRWTSSNST